MLISCLLVGGFLRSAQPKNRVIGGLSKERALEKRRYLLTGGGTGGHVYPAIAVADELRRREPEAAFLYVGVKGKSEEKIVPKRGYEIRFVSSEGWPGARPSVALLRFAWRLSVGILQSILILRRYQPHAIIATGGYVSAPILLAWVLLRRLKLTQARAFVHESNLMPGRLNLLIGKLADRTGVSFEESRRYLPQAEFVGYPVRKEMVGITQAEARGRLNIPLDARVVLAFGGSQGARTINRALIDALPRLLQDPKMWVIHGVGRLDSPSYRAEHDTQSRFSALSLSEEQRKRYSMHTYLDPIEEYYAAADLVVGRGGAGTLTEMAVCGLAALIIPKANLPGDHQVRNARALQDNGAADVVYEHAQRTEEGLIDVVNGEDLAAAEWLLEKAVAACQQAHPNEACGLWWKTSEGWGIHAFTAPPLTTTPTRYAISPEVLLPILKQIDQEEGRICGWFHSHPEAPPFLSDADISMYWASSRWAWWPETQILLLSPTQDAYAWCLYAPTASGSWEAVAWGSTRSNSQAETIL